MTELLAPAGNMEALKAAISNGCDAIYLGMQKFGARAYSNNFDLYENSKGDIWVISSNGVYVVPADDLIKNKINTNKNIKIRVRRKSVK